MIHAPADADDFLEKFQNILKPKIEFPSSQVIAIFLGFGKKRKKSVKYALPALPFRGYP